MDNNWLSDEEYWRLWNSIIEYDPIIGPELPAGLRTQAEGAGQQGQLSRRCDKDVLRCNQDDCTKVYGRKSELDRHVREEHMGQSSRFLCPVDLCPRSIEGEGFARMCQLTAHLTTKQKGHNMDKTRAKYEARKANPQKNGAKKE